MRIVFKLIDESFFARDHITADHFLGTDAGMQHAADQDVRKLPDAAL